MSKIYAVLFAVCAFVMSAGQALAEDFFTAPTLTTTNLGTMATAILAALALIWGVRKAIKMINRS